MLPRQPKHFNYLGDQHPSTQTTKLNPSIHTSSNTEFQREAYEADKKQLCWRDQGTKPEKTVKNRWVDKLHSRQNTEQLNMMRVVGKVTIGHSKNKEETTNLEQKAPCQDQPEKTLS
eukprot:TRINITY_DN66352_c1_g1_i6.p2 TRINITY_DN66352_c1_g1~~TRINITY_DN66352_c1_g1_i6.p2  ORF type:complete len:117 (-),score=12.12 TRINITY_DN66352_c1_g1_i6:7-357(-)